MLSFLLSPVCASMLLGRVGSTEAYGLPRLSEYECGDDGKAQGCRSCFSRSLCAITAASGHLPFCLPGDRGCP